MGAFQRFAAELGYTLTIKDYAHSVFFAGVPCGLPQGQQGGPDPGEGRRAVGASGTPSTARAAAGSRSSTRRPTSSRSPGRPVDAALKEAAQANLNEISNAFGVPGYFIGRLGSTRNTYANLETRRQDLVMFTLLPWTSRIEAVLDAQFPRGVELKVTLDALLRGTTLDRYTAHASAIAAGWKTARGGPRHRGPATR